MTRLLSLLVLATASLGLAGCAAPGDGASRGSAVAANSGSVGLGGRPDAGPGSASDTRAPRRDGTVGTTGR